MTDSELLELAAKAAGCTYLNAALWDGKEVVEYEWNPLVFDDDALRLAVKLGIDLEVIHPRDRVELGRSRAGDRWQLHNDDPYAATRRAIVRAAAEIGMSMK